LVGEPGQEDEADEDAGEDDVRSGEGVGVFGWKTRCQEEDVGRCCDEEEEDLSSVSL